MSAIPLVSGLSRAHRTTTVDLVFGVLMEVLIPVHRFALIGTTVIKREMDRSINPSLS
jgi:hypothetical protein